MGNKLKVDTVLLYSITQKSGEPNWTMAIYFIDVETKKTFSQTKIIIQLCCMSLLTGQ